MINLGNMDCSLDANQIADVTGLPLRRVRYVLEHHVLPGTRQKSLGHRVTRYFLGSEAFGIALAAAMLEAGLRRPLVARCIAVLATKERPPPSSSGNSNVPIIRAYLAKGPTCLEVGDAVNVRLSVERSAGAADAAWVQVATGAPLRADYAPLILVRVDAARLRDPIRKAAGG